jgi:hypothetical protein
MAAELGLSIDSSGMKPGLADLDSVVQKSEGHCTTHARHMPRVASPPIIMDPATYSSRAAFEGCSAATVASHAPVQVQRKLNVPTMLRPGCIHWQ